MFGEYLGTAAFTCGTVIITIIIIITKSFRPLLRYGQRYGEAPETPKWFKRPAVSLGGHYNCGRPPKSPVRSRPLPGLFPTSSREIYAARRRHFNTGRNSIGPDRVDDNGTRAILNSLVSRPCRCVGAHKFITREISEIALITSHTSVQFRGYLLAYFIIPYSLNVNYYEMFSRTFHYGRFDRTPTLVYDRRSRDEQRLSSVAEIVLFVLLTH